MIYPHQVKYSRVFSTPNGAILYHDNIAMDRWRFWSQSGNTTWSVYFAYGPEAHKFMGTSRPFKDEIQAVMDDFGNLVKVKG